MADIQALVDMGVDLYFNRDKVAKFSQADPEKAYREKVLDITGGKFDIEQMLDPVKRHQIFSLVQKTIDMIIPNVLQDQFMGFAEVNTVNYGEKLIFDVTDPRLFPVAKVSAGNKDLQAQRLDNGSLILDPDWYGVKIREEFFRWASGRINFPQMINKIALSMTNKIGTDVYKSITDTYSTLDANYKASGTFDATKFNTLVDRVHAYGNMETVVFGTRLALRKVIESGVVSYNMMDELNKNGFLARFQGTSLFMIPQAINPATNDLAISNDYLIIVPTGDAKICKIGFEGAGLIDDSQASPTKNKDLSIEYTYLRRYATGVLSASKYALYNMA